MFAPAYSTARPKRILNVVFPCTGRTKHHHHERLPTFECALVFRDAGQEDTVPVKSPLGLERPAIFPILSLTFCFLASFD